MDKFIEAGGGKFNFSADKKVNKVGQHKKMEEVSVFDILKTRAKVRKGQIKIFKTQIVQLLKQLQY